MPHARAVTWIACLGITMSFGARLSEAAIIHVPADHPTIQAAIDAAADGDEIVVAPGLYAEQIEIASVTITVRSIAGPELTIIDGTGLVGTVGDPLNGSVVTMTNAPNAALEGFTVMGGIGTDVDNGFGLTHGGGLYIDGLGQPHVRGCIIAWNTALAGGGALVDGDPVFIDCVFHNNVALTFQGLPDSPGGGGARVEAGDPIFVNCVFRENQAVGTTDGSAGGETAGGGGLSNSLGETSLFNCVFLDNTTSNDGGAAAAFNGGTIRVLHCSLVGNSAVDGGAVAVGSPSDIDLCSSIVWGNVPDQLFNSAQNPFDADYSNVQGGIGGIGNIDVNPLFVDLGNGNLRLFPTSPCVDSGDFGPCDQISGIPEIFLDREGNDRVLDGDLDGQPRSDMGAYEATGYLVRNLTLGTFWNRIANALIEATDGDELLTEATAFGVETAIDFDGTGARLESLGAIDQPAGGTMQSADGCGLVAAPGAGITLAGQLETSSGDRMDLIGDTLVVEATSIVTIGAGSVLDVSVGSTAVWQGSTFIDPFASLSVSSAVDLGGPLTIYDGAIDVPSLTVVPPSGSLTGFGTLITNLTNDTNATYLADTQVVGDYVNNGTTTVQNGTLTIIGSLTDNGTIVGDVAGGSPGPDGPVAGGDGLTVLVDYAAGTSASLLMPSPDLTVKIGGHFDVAIDDSGSYDMVLAELRMIGLGDASQDLESMSVDIGPDPAGLDRSLPGHYPIGTLRLGPAATTVDVVDIHDNDGFGQGVCEAIYVENLVIEQDAMLNTLGCPVYYVNLTLDGAVDDPANLIQIEAAPPCPGDVDGNGVVDVSDLLDVLSAWGSCPGCPEDVTGDGAVDVSDVLVVLGAWGPC